jgi:hypothetical protein
MRTCGLPIVCSFLPLNLRVLGTPGRACWALLLPATLVRMVAPSCGAPQELHRLVE